MRVIVTRPAEQAASWVQSLVARGIDAAALPLIEIAPPADPQAVVAAWRLLGQQRLAVFVSPNAAQAFLAQRPPDVAWPASTLAGATGPGTRDALRAHGVPEAAVVAPPPESAQFDSEALWQRLRDADWNQAPVLVVRGDGGREWLADTLRERGAQVSFVAAYRRVLPRWDAAERRVLDDALAAPERHLWLFSSSEGIDHLVQAVPHAAWSSARAIATHPRIAQRASERGFGAVHACRPTLDAVVACIQSLAS